MGLPAWTGRSVDAQERSRLGEAVARGGTTRCDPAAVSPSKSGPPSATPPTGTERIGRRPSRGGAAGGRTGDGFAWQDGPPPSRRPVSAQRVVVACAGLVPLVLVPVARSSARVALVPFGLAGVPSDCDG